MAAVAALPDDGVTCNVFRPDLPDPAIESSVAIAIAVHVVEMVASPVPA
jgi:hypothetical protein